MNAMTPSLWPAAELLPHAGDMILIDEVLEFDEEQIRTRTLVRPGGLFNRADGSLPAWVAIELMAQSVAAYAGCQAKVKGESVELGFLLGTRKFECNVEHFPAGSELLIHAQRSLQDDNGMGVDQHFPAGSELLIHAQRSLQDDNGMGVFECLLTGPDIQVVARLNVYRPPQSAGYLAEGAAHD